MPRWLVVILVLIVGFCLLSMAAFLALPMIMQAFLPKVGTVLVYEMEDLRPSENPAEVAAKTVRALDLRLNPGMRLQLAKVRALPDHRIEVGVYGADEITVEKVKDLIAFTGKLEFRIVANTHKHKTEIELAKNDREKTVYYDASGKNWIARWVKVKPGERFLSSNLTRERTLGDKKWTEVLVVNDLYSVTGDYLASAKPCSDEHGRPYIQFSFNSSGGKLFGALTGDNVPDPAQPELKNQLGIILDGVVYSAPSILTTITNNGQITGNFTRQEVEQIVSVLNAGSLPVNLRKVEERSADAK
jgi:SecD/SecF fusion protein